MIFALLYVSRLSEKFFLVLSQYLQLRWQYWRRYLWLQPAFGGSAHRREIWLRCGKEYGRRLPINAPYSQLSKKSILTFVALM